MKILKCKCLVICLCQKIVDYAFSCFQLLDYRYAALQGTKCFCGAEFGKYGVTTGCTTKCAAAPLEGCGGHRKNLVYDIGKSDE